jgi:hypothetical protein
MAPQKASGPARRHGGAGRAKSKPVERAAGKDAAPGLTLVDIDPWGAFEKLWEQPGEGEPADQREGERKAGPRTPATKSRPRRSPRSS